MIQVCDLAEQYRQLKEEIDAAMQAAAAAGQYILGPNVKALEKEIAAYCGSAFGIGVNSGTDALHLALRALRIGPGDEVITTPFTFIATTEAIGMVGATPVFVDIDLATFNMDPARIEEAITPRTRAILPVHLYGQPCDMDAIMAIAREHDLRVIEDCAQALGATYRGKMVGTFGDVGCLSFFPSKNLGAFGDGGMAITDNAEIAGRIEMLRRHGGKVKYHHSELGLNSRLDDLQAAILRVKLPRLEGWVAARRERAYRYNAQFFGHPTVVTPRERIGQEVRCPKPGMTFAEDQLRVAYHQYTVLVEDREGVQARLKNADVASMVYYPVPLHLQEVHAELGYGEGSFPQAEYAARHCLSLPMYPEMRREQQEVVISALKAAVASSETLAA